METGNGYAGDGFENANNKLPLKRNLLGTRSRQAQSSSVVRFALDKKARLSPSPSPLQVQDKWNNNPELPQRGVTGKRSRFDGDDSSNGYRDTPQRKVAGGDALCPLRVIPPPGSCFDERTDRLKIQDFKPLDARDSVDSKIKSSQLDIASTSNEEVKIALICRSFGNSTFRDRSLNAVIGEVEDECRRKYRIHDPDFSLKKLMEKVCEYFLEMDNNCRSGHGVPLSPDNDNDNKAIIPFASLLDKPKISVVKDFRSKNDYNGNCTLQPSHLSDTVEGTGTFGGSEKKIKVTKAPKPINQSNMKAAVLQSKYPLYLKDITKGQESVEIPLVNGSSSANLELPSFMYIKSNKVFKAAHVDFSLARVSNYNCCTRCYKDCLSSALPCQCAAETRGEFAYTQEGLLKEEFLEESLAMSRQPEGKHLYYCEICPLVNDLQQIGGRVKPCKGHLTRKFVKECWYRCGCNKKCGNRVVQRGIQVNLQVFATPKGKGWGVRCMHGLKKGTFVCEYVGEIVTNMELYERNNERTAKQERHTYPVLLDADWGSERILKDEEALCLDATEFGNVGRFINHRCYDANLIEIPVEVETPDHHYYHLAFFASRDVKAREELTWDYGIRFDDINHPVKAFKCRCGSPYCRDKKKTAVSRYIINWS